MKLRFGSGDIVELPKRLGGGTGVVAYSFASIRGDGDKRESIERCGVARIVDGKQRTTIVPEDELYRIGGRA